MKVKFGIQQPRFPSPGTAHRQGVYATVERVAREADRLGFDSFWLMDHFIQIPPVDAPTAPILEPWVVLGSLAAVTTRIRLGTMVTGVPYRNPALLAKMGATLDVVSGGRLFMGMGAGWYQREFDAYGWPFPERGERIRRLAEAVQVVTAMWTQESPTFEGRYYTVKEALCEPRPVQKPRPPILVGGGGEQGTLRVVARYADASNIFGSPQTVRHKLDVLARHCHAVGRDPATVVKTRLGSMLLARSEGELARKLERYPLPSPQDEEGRWRTIAGTPQQCAEACAQLLRAGLDYLIFSFPDAETLEPLQIFMEEVAPALAES
ncbi:MAG: LLM class F420-dependent oxidoreductase [Chloroflexi bacterium]|nr:LLM class F420-dependent oxidoreductase [Chloroflexota bacterium]